MTLTHVNDQGRARMVDVSHKPTSTREARASGRVVMRPETLATIRDKAIAKGDALAVAQIAGIMGAKSTAATIPLCHPLPLTGIDLDFDTDIDSTSVHITSHVRTTAQTGVEMEALAAVTAAALTIYDMCKAIDKTMIIGEIRVIEKSK